MKKIIVAGAGHGGISAAYNLAKKGYDVTVYEHGNREEMGYDWDDTICRTAFAESGMESPDDSVFSTFLDMSYTNTKKTVKIISDNSGKTVLGFIDRKFLSDYLLSQAENAGVKFVYGAEIKSVITAGQTVKGIRVEKNGTEYSVYGDIVIDAAGMDSPVRRTLPAECGIKNEITQEETFSVYRVYYNKLDGFDVGKSYNVYFFHCSRPGMDWVLTGDNFVDILVGSFGSLDENDVKLAIEDFRKEYPYMGTEIIRGGSFCKIPLRKTLPVFVCNGYAAVGDSASMTEPLSGSGVTLSMRAGKMLADVIEKAGDSTYSVDILWEYEYTYLKQLGNRYLNDAVIKSTLSSITSDDIDTLMEQRVISDKELAGGKYKSKDITDKGKAFAKNPYLIPPFAKAGIGISKIGMIKKTMPEKYDAVKVALWAKEYEKL